MIRYDGKGFHPTVRPFIPHRKKERNKIKVMSIISPKAWQLAMMRLGISFVSDMGNRIRLINLIDSDETMMLAPMCGGIISCGAAGDYCAVQANPSRPPPDLAFQQQIENVGVNDNPSAETQTTACNHSLIDRLQKSLKLTLRILMSLVRILPFIPIAIMASSCQKEHDVIIDWKTEPIFNSTQQKKEIIQKEVNKRSVNMIFLDFG
ncbi:MAG: hypothetical protein IJ622_09030 [Bacteroidales bacterium]|nr:hypothetical protein [Bacteroidales bacterium]